MWIGDDEDVRFEMNFPLKRDDWPGTMTCIGSSGSGKTYHVVEMIRRYFKAAPVHSRRQVVWLSPELKIDTTLKKLRDNERYRLWFHGIDISEKNLKEKGMDAASFYQKEITEKIDGMGENLILVLDDFPDAARLPRALLQLHAPGRAAPQLRRDQPDPHVRPRQGEQPGPAKQQELRVLP